MINFKQVLAGAAISAAFLCAHGAEAADYTVQPGDSLWKLSQRYQVSIDAIKTANSIKGDIIYIGQIINLSDNLASNVDSAVSPTLKSSETNRFGERVYTGEIVYTIEAGDTIAKIAAKTGVSAADLFKFNYLKEEDIIYTGDKLYIDGYAPRSRTIAASRSGVHSNYGQLVDWFLDGKYLLKTGCVMTIVDLATKAKFNVQMIGGYNHCDVEPVTAADVGVMKKLFGSWTWTPRPVVIYYQDMNIAGSLSGMPHSIDTIPDNGLAGHFDMYLYNSKPHGEGVSKSYVQQHYSSVLKAAGK